MERDHVHTVNHPLTALLIQHPVSGHLQGKKLLSRESMCLELLLCMLCKYCDLSACYVI